MARHDATAMKWLLGATLRNHRRAARKTLLESATHLGVSESKISNMESGRYGQAPSEVGALLGFYGAAPERVARITELAEPDDVNTWWSPWSSVIPKWLQLFAGLEGMAEVMFIYEPLVVHALLQTENYAAAIAGSARRLRPADMDQVVSFRLESQRRLHDPQAPLRLQAVIEESVLHRPVGDRQTMQGQLKHLIELNRLPNVDIRVIKTEVGVHVGHNGQFTLLHFSDFDDAVYVELQEDAVYLNDSSRVRAYNLSSTSLLKLALGQGETVSLITSLIKEL